MTYIMYNVLQQNCNVTRFLDCWNFDLFAFGRLCEGVCACVCMCVCVCVCVVLTNGKHFIPSCVGRPLYHLGLRLFQKHNLFVNLRLDHFKVMRFLSKLLNTHMQHTNYTIFVQIELNRLTITGLAEESYHGENPYHNGTHATDVTQALNCLISTKEVC